VIHRLAFSLLVAACGLALAASAQEPKDKPDKKEAPAEGENPQDKIKEILSRLDDNFGKASERLDKKDPGQDTRKIQDDIIKDLDELIKQQQNGGGGGGANQQCNNPSGGGGQGQQGGSSSSQQQQQASSQQKSGGGQQGKQKSPQSLSDEQRKPGGSQGQEKKEDGLAKKGGGKEEKEGKDQQAKGEGEKKSKGSGNGGGGDANAKEKNTIADLYKDVWGHLPAHERPKMDVYSRERFMPRYEDLLRQYYRTIAEQGRRNEGE
jgi:hypothetical protein